MADVKNLNVAGNVLVSNDVTISGNLDVLGTTTTITSSTVAITDKDLVLAKDNTTDASADGAGIIIKAGTDKTILYNYNGGNDKFAINIPLDVTGAITGATVATTSTITATGGFIGDGSQITNITAAGINAPGNNTEIVFNNNGPFGSDSNLTFDANTGTLTTTAMALSTPLPISSGGTGASTAAGVRTALSLSGSDNVGFANINGADITASGALATSTLVSSGLADLQNGLTVTGGNTTLTNDLTVNGVTNLTGQVNITDDIIDIGIGSSNAGAQGLKIDKGTGSRTGYFTWSKTNSRWDAYYSDQATGGAPFVKTVMNADVLGDVTGDVVGNVTGDVTGNLTGDVTGNVTGDVTGTVSDISNHTTDALSEGSTNVYFTDERVDDRVANLIVAGTNMTATYDDAAGTLTLASTATGSGYDLSGNDTDDLAEGVNNLYYTTTRFDTRLGTKTTDDLAEGTSNLYYTDARADVRATLRINAATTDNISEGTGNLYFTDARADARIANNIIDEDSFASDDATRAPSQQSTKAYIASQIALKDNTDEITEGSSNLYFTDARARAVSIENVVEDGSPELGGNLDLNGNNINGTGNIDFTGIVKLGAITSTSGTGGEIRWTGSDFVGYDGSAWNSLTEKGINQNTHQIANFTSSQTVTSTSYSDISGYVTNTTTTQTGSKLKISVNLVYKTSGADPFVKLVRTIGATDTDVIEYPVTQVGTNQDDNLTFTIIDQPNQSSGTVVQYKLQAKSGTGTLTFNSNTTNNQISIEEIAATPVAVESVNGASGIVSLDLDDIADVDTTSVADGAGIIKDGSNYVATSNNTGAMIMPVGTTAQRPGSPVQGMIRFNTTTSKFEGYNGSDWINLVEEDLGNLS